VADRSALTPAALADGAAPPSAWPPGTRPWPYGTAGGIAGAGAAGRVPDTYGDVLPPVRYGPRGQPSAPPTWPGPAAPGVPATPATRSPAGPLLVGASIAAAVAISLVFPVVGTVAALVALMALRAGDRAAGGMSRRRARRGSRASDPLLAAAMFPPALAWSVIRSALFLPLALVAAAIAAVVAIVAVPNHAIPVACAYAAGMLVVFYGLGPGSGGARRPIRSFFDSVADTPLRATAAFIAVAGVFVAAVVVVAAHPPFFWPFGSLATWLGHFNIVHTVLHETRAKVLRVFGRS